MVRNKAMRSMAASILTTMLAGLIFFFFDFHYREWPEYKSKVQVLNSELDNTKQILQRVDNRTQKIYEILLEKSQLR